MTARTSLTPAVTADSSTKRRSAAVATRWASVVLPVPGGPQMIAESGPAAPPDPSMRRRSGLPGRSTSAWPRTSSRERGRIRTASGGMAGRGRLLRAVGGGRGTEEVVSAHCGRLSTCSTPRPGPRPPTRPRRGLRWPDSPDDARVLVHGMPDDPAGAARRLIARHPRRLVLAWVLITFSCFAVAVGGVTGESLFNRLHSGAPTVDSESTQAQRDHRADPARPRDA